MRPAGEWVGLSRAMIAQKMVERYPNLAVRQHMADVLEDLIVVASLLGRRSDAAAWLKLRDAADTSLGMAAVQENI